MSDFFKKHRKILCTSAGIYLVWVLFWLIYSKVLLPDVMTHFMGEAWKPSDFAISYTASAADSFVFFTVVGLAITFISLRRPEEEKLATKIEYIFPDADSDTALGKFLANKVSALACISPVTKRVITLQQVLEDRKAIKVMAKTDSIIKNIHNNHHYATDSMSFGARIDEIDIDGDILGEINDIKIQFDLEDPSKNMNILNGVHTMTSSNNTFNETFSLKLEPGQVVNYQTSAWLWNSLEKPLRFIAPRFTESQSIIIHNETDYVIDFKVAIPNDSDEIFQIQPGRSHTIKVDACTPDEKVIMQFTKWKLLD